MRHRIELGHEDTDIDLVLPNGQVIKLQYRLENPSIDICLPTECGVTNWKGNDMEPAKMIQHCPHYRYAKQLVIDLASEWTN